MYVFCAHAYVFGLKHATYNPRSQGPMKLIIVTEISASKVDTETSESIREVPNMINAMGGVANTKTIISLIILLGPSR